MRTAPSRACLHTAGVACSPERLAVESPLSLCALKVRDQVRGHMSQHQRSGSCEDVRFHRRAIFPSVISSGKRNPRLTWTKERAYALNSFASFLWNPTWSSHLNIIWVRHALECTVALLLVTPHRYNKHESKCGGIGQLGSVVSVRVTPHW